MSRCCTTWTSRTAGWRRGWAPGSSAAAVARLALVDEWRFAYQSAGATPEPWLGPEAGAVITELAPTRKNFLIVPIGFVSDHVEVLYDVDVAYRGLAARLGARLERRGRGPARPSRRMALRVPERRCHTRAMARARGGRRHHRARPHAQELPHRPDRIRERSCRGVVRRGRRVPRAGGAVGRPARAPRPWPGSP